MAKRLIHQKAMQAADGPQVALETQKQCTALKRKRLRAYGQAPYRK